MPRIPYATLLRAQKISPFLPPVLRATRDLPSAIRELRWLVEHLQERNKGKSLSSSQEKKQLLKLCKRREKSEPLQYILGSQPFGPLDIICRWGVLIPRPETESIAQYAQTKLLDLDLHPQLSRYWLSNKGQPQYGLPIRVLDLCSGSGCISLLMQSGEKHGELIKTQSQGVDISPLAISVARENARRYRDKLPKHQCPPTYHQADIFNSQQLLEEGIDGHYEIIISNPPYISSKSFRKEVTRSVRNWEPKLALLPDLGQAIKWPELPPEDIFYRRVLDLHCYTSSNSSPSISSLVLIMEVGDDAQALRVIKLAYQAFGDQKHISIWRDNLCGTRVRNPRLFDWSVGGRRITSRGHGKVRAVVCNDISWSQNHPELIGKLKGDEKRPEFWPNEKSIELDTGTHSPRRIGTLLPLRTIRKYCPTLSHLRDDEVLKLDRSTLKEHGFKHAHDFDWDDWPSHYYATGWDHHI